MGRNCVRIRARIRVVVPGLIWVDTGLVSNAQWMVNREVKCRCGQMGVITGVEDGEDAPNCVWVAHTVRLSMQTHIHRAGQMPAILAQLKS